MSEDLSQNLAKNLIYLRKTKGLSQQRLADISGLPRATIANLENGEANPSIKTLLKITGALQIRIDELLSFRRAGVEHIKARNVKVRKIKDGAIKIFKLIPEDIGYIDFEKLEIKAGFSKTGTPHLPRTKEYFHCLRGEITILVEGEKFILNQGDVLSFAGNQKHSYLNETRKSVEGVSVVVFN